jgi:NTE family protein
MPMRRKEADYRYLLNFEIGYKNGHVITPVGVVQGQKLLLLLRRLLISTWDVSNFDDLTIPFRAVATDIVNGKAVIFANGDLPLAIRSSMSVPGAFAPTNVNGQLLVDGGVMDNVPVDVIRTMGTDRLIVVDVGSPLLDREQLSNPVALLNQMVGTLMNDKTRAQLETLGPNDLLITPELGKLGSGEFNRCKEAADIGHAAAEAVVARLRTFSAPPDVWRRFQDSHRKRTFDPGLLAFLKVDPAQTMTADYIAMKMQPNVGKPLDADRLEKQVGEIYGRGNYQQIDYRLEGDDKAKGLMLIPVDKPWGPVYGRFGLQLDNDFNGLNQYMLSAEINATNINRFGAEWRTSIWTGRILGVRTELFQPMGEGAALSAMPYGFVRVEDIPVFEQGGGKQLSEYRIHRWDGGLEVAWSPVSYWRLFGGFERGHDNGVLRIGDPTSFPSSTSDFAATRIGLEWDSLDDAQFPTRGAHVQFAYDFYRPFLGGDQHGDVAHLIADWVPNWWGEDNRYHLLLGTRVASATDNANFFEAQSFLGGFLNLSGFNERALYGNQSMFGRAVLYRRTGALDTMFSTPFYVGASLEAGNVWHNTSDVSLGNLLFAGSVFAGIKTPIGPVFLGYGYAQGGHNALYLTFGSLLRPEQ